MQPDKREMQMHDALWALNRIARKVGGFLHDRSGKTCDCPQCIAKDALERIKQREMETVEK